MWEGVVDEKDWVVGGEFCRGLECVDVSVRLLKAVRRPGRCYRSFTIAVIESIAYSRLVLLEGVEAGYA